MRNNPRLSALVLLSIVFLAGLSIFQMSPSGQVAAAALPSQLTDKEFWTLATESSEVDGTFRSDNLLSNETTFQYVIPDLLRIVKQGRVYMGVGPEQNFTYIAALKPAMAIIVDIRHGNFDVHLLYKALFELSRDRAEFVSRLFSRKRPEGLTARSSAAEIFNAILVAEGSEQLYNENLKAIEDHLTTKHGFPLTAGDREGIAWALVNYNRYGPWINYGSSLSQDTPPDVVGVSSSFGNRGNSGVNYLTLMTANDGAGQYRSFLANEENFNFLKDMQSRNLVVPVVGDFGGDKAIRAVGKYLKSVDATVSAFYLSNVEQYLLQDGKWDLFCKNVATLPLDETSMFIRSGRGGPYTPPNIGGGVQNSSTAQMLQELMNCAPRR